MLLIKSLVQTLRAVLQGTFLYMFSEYHWHSWSPWKQLEMWFNKNVCVFNTLEDLLYFVQIFEIHIEVHFILYTELQRYHIFFIHFFRKYLLRFQNYVAFWAMQNTKKNKSYLFEIICPMNKHSNTNPTLSLQLSIIFFIYISLLITFLPLFTVW